jgi:hypothetical protein
MFIALLVETCSVYGHRSEQNRRPCTVVTQCTLNILNPHLTSLTLMHFEKHITVLLTHFILVALFPMWVTLEEVGME